MKTVLGFLGAVVAAYVVAVLMYSQFNLSNLVEMGIEVDFGLRLHTAVHDLTGMVGIYFPVLIVAFLIAFAVTRLILKWVPQLRTVGYILSGFMAIFAVDAILGATFGMHPLAVTRTTMGLLGQCVAGAVGGYVFAWITTPADEKSYLAS